jgi:hypothetical protein
MVKNLGQTFTCCSSSFIIFVHLIGGVCMNILQLLILIQASLTTYFRWVIICYLVFVVVLSCFKKSQLLIKKMWGTIIS